MTYTANDLSDGGTAVVTPAGSGAATTATKTITIWSSSSDNPPDVTAPATRTVNEDAPLDFTGGNKITIADVDAFTVGTVTVDLSVTKGYMGVATSGSVTIVGGSNYTGTSR